jgi:hypothetical protein
MSSPAPDDGVATIAPAAAISQADDTPLFDITTPAYQNNTYVFTQEELWALADTLAELERRYDLKVTRYNLVRLALHGLIEDYRRRGDTSFVVRRLRKRPA